MIEQITERLKKSLFDKCSEAYLYGSQLSERRKDRDIDIVLVCNEAKTIDEVAYKVSLVQREFQELIHAIFITKSDIKNNEQLRALIRNSKRLW